MQKQKSALFSLGLLSLLAAVMLYRSTFPWHDTPDGWIHLYRVRALADALQMGKWFPRWFPDFSFGYGYPVLNFYAPAFYYPPALLAALGIDVLSATRIALAAIYAVSGFAMGLLLLNFNSTLPAFVGTVVYLAFPYRLYDLFVRGALPEFAAFFWLPLLLHFVVRACQQTPHPQPKVREIFANPYLFATTFTWLALILTHNLTALMALIALIVALPVVAGFMTRSVSVMPADAVGASESFVRRWLFSLVWLGGRLGLPLFLSTLLSAWYWLPALWEARWVGIGAGESSAGYFNHFANWTTLFSWDLFYHYPFASEATVPLPGWLGIALAINFLLLFLSRFNLPYKRSNYLFSLMLLFCGWMMMSNSAIVWRASELVLGKLQFPWRWQTILSLAAAGLVANLGTQLQAWSQNRGEIKPLQEIRLHRKGAILLASVASLLFALQGLWGLGSLPRLSQPPDLSNAAMWATDAKNGQIGASWTGEFLPEWVTEQRWAIGRAPSSSEFAGDESPIATAQEFGFSVDRVGYDQATYHINSTQPVTLTTHQFYYPAWQVQVDGVAVASEPSGNLGLLSFRVEPGDHQIDVWFGATTAVWFGRGLTLLGVAFLLLLTLLYRLTGWGMIRWRWLSISLFGGAVLFLGASSVGTVAIYPNQPNLDYGTVRMVGAEIPSVKSDITVPIRLHWLIVDPGEALVAFVHVVRPDGTVIAQYDSPLAGEYTPVERWQPGLLLNNTHFVTLPPDLPPGEYEVLAGLYPAGQPEKPLLAAGRTEPRTAIGTVEVRP